MNLNLTQLQNFIHVVEWGSISKAAMVLNVAQPALSRQIRSLEAAFGAILLRRHSWGVELTADGGLVLEHARRILKECASAKDSVQLNRDNPGGSVYFGVPSAYAISFAPPLLERMRVRYPNITVHVVEAFSGTIYEWLVTGRLDLAILYFSKEHDAAETEPFLDEEMIALGAPGVFGGVEAIPLAALADRRLIAPWRPHMHRLALESTFLAAGVPFSPGIEIDSLPCMMELAHRGDGIAVLPPSTVARELETGRLSGVRVAPEIRLTTVLGQTPGRKPTRAVSILQQELKALARDLAPEKGWNATAS